jgi:tripartite-type tricarboxylate transporter receptor subunit TctC
VNGRGRDRDETSRRKFLHLAAGAAALPAVSRFAWAQAYPARPVRIVVGALAGGGIDAVARAIGPWLTERLGQPFVIENHPGPNGLIGTELVARSEPDGYTLLLVATAHAINATLFDKLNFDFIRDIAPVAGVLLAPLVMTVNSTFPAKSIAEFIAYAKANPGKVNFASGASGVPSHIAGELFKVMTGVNMLHVPYRGDTLALVDLLAGKVQVHFVGLPPAIEHIRSGKLHALAVTTAMRLQALPDIPTVGDFVPGYEASIWFGIGAPRNTPTGIVEKLNKEINVGLVDPKMSAPLAELGGTVLAGSPADFGKLIADETEK